MTTKKANLEVLDQMLLIKISLSDEEAELIKTEIGKEAIQDVSLFSWAWGHKEFGVSYPKAQEEDKKPIVAEEKNDIKDKK